MFIKKEDILPYIKEDLLEQKIKELADRLNQDYKGEKLCLVCVLKGAVMFATTLAKKLEMPLKMEFIRLSSYGNGRITSGKVNAVDISLPDLNGENVLIVEDIIDTGVTAKFLMDFINTNFKTKSTKFCSMLDKKCCRKVDIDPDYYAIEVENKFLVGFGLDCEEYYRNIPYVGYVED